MNKLGFNPITFAITVIILCDTEIQGQKPELVVQTGHHDHVASIVFSPDGKTLVSGGWDHTIKFWDVQSGLLLRTIDAQAQIESLAFSPDGQKVASCGGDTIKLWDARYGQLLHTFVGTDEYFLDIAFSPDGSVLASGGESDGLDDSLTSTPRLKLWDTLSGQMIRSFKGHVGKHGVRKVAFNSEGSILASFIEGQIKLWDIRSGQTIHEFYGYGFDFSSDGKLIWVYNVDTVSLLNTQSGRPVHKFKRPVKDSNCIKLSNDGKTLAIAHYPYEDLDNPDFTITLWNTRSGEKIQSLVGHSDTVMSLAFSPDSHLLAGSGKAGDPVIRLWDVQSGKVIRLLTGLTTEISAVGVDGQVIARDSGPYGYRGSESRTFQIQDLLSGQITHSFSESFRDTVTVDLSPDGKVFYITDMDKTKLWDVQLGRVIAALDGSGKALSSNNRLLALLLPGNYPDCFLKLYDLKTGQILHSLEVATDDHYFIAAFSFDGKLLAFGNRQPMLLSTDSGRILHKLADSGPLKFLVFSPDGKTLLSSDGDNVVLNDTRTGQSLFEGSISDNHFRSAAAFSSAAFSPDGKVIAFGCYDGQVRIWDTKTKQMIQSLTGHSNYTYHVSFSSDGNYLFSNSADLTVKLWRVADGKLLATIYLLGKEDWAAVTPEGIFDASPNGQKQMHFVVGLEPISLEQLKERYYQPGLLAILLGHKKEELRKIGRLDRVDLYPEVKYSQPAPGKLKLPMTLINRGGGIGRVQVFVNGKEFIADARTKQLKRNPNVPQVTLTIDLSRATFRAGQSNNISIIAWNAEGYASSRSSDLVYQDLAKGSLRPPEVYAIIGGVSDYTGERIDLRFAGKDAADFATAIQLGAKRLFGADKIHMTLLSDANDPRAILPTKDNFRRAFEAGRKVKPDDILIVYLAGHGVTAGRGSDLYCYLTREARSAEASVLADPVVREQTAITSEDLTEWIKQIPALKQVMILDTCAAGAAAAGLRLTDKRDLSSDQIRAIERLKDRTGLFVLMGSAADAVSYEASQYGQGLLTYALLEGMKGAALREDEFVDIGKLFTHAVDRVPQLAQNVGGIQRPRIRAPQSQPFDVGQLRNEDKQAIPLAQVKPLILRPRFLDPNAGDDTLELVKNLRRLLRDESYVGIRADGVSGSLVFVDDEEFPGAIRPTGTYTVSGDSVKVKLNLRRDNVTLKSAEVEGTKSDIAAKVMASIKETIPRL